MSNLIPKYGIYDIISSDDGEIYLDYYSNNILIVQRWNIIASIHYQCKVKRKQ